MVNNNSNNQKTDHILDSLLLGAGVGLTTLILWCGSPALSGLFFGGNKSYRTKIEHVLHTNHPHHRNIARNHERHLKLTQHHENMIKQFNAGPGHDYMYRDPGRLGGMGGHIVMGREPPSFPGGDGSFHLHGKAPDYHSRNPFDEHHSGRNPFLNFTNPFPQDRNTHNDGVARYRSSPYEDFDHMTHPSYNV